MDDHETSQVISLTCPKMLKKTTKT